MSTSKRVQRTRRAGQPGMPPGAKYVGRGTRWGNPYRVTADAQSWIVLNPDGGVIASASDSANARRISCDWYRAWLHGPSQADLLAAARDQLAGRDLACWCPLPEPGQPDHCHAAVLLECASQDPKTAALLNQAADYLEQHGWLQGDFDNLQGAVCAVAAIRAVAPPAPNRQRSAGERACLAALAKHLGLKPDPADSSPIADRPGVLVTAWNDRAANAAEVLASMRGTAEHLAKG